MSIGKFIFIMLGYYLLYYALKNEVRKWRGSIDQVKQYIIWRTTNVYKGRTLQ